jgi:hypothetical protein
MTHRCGAASSVTSNGFTAEKGFIPPNAKTKKSRAKKSRAEFHCRSRLPDLRNEIARIKSRTAHLRRGSTLG